jgi:uncharacterized protein (DUF2237 family)
MRDELVLGKILQNEGISIIGGVYRELYCQCSI